MTMSVCKVLFWVDEFKNNWLPKHIPNNHDLTELIIDKINELEHILTPENTPNVNESSDFNECQHEPEDTSHQDDTPIATVLSNHTDEDIENQELFSWPSIRIKRIPLAEAELYMPEEWKLAKPRRGKRKNQKKLPAIVSKGSTVKKSSRQMKTPLASTQDTSANEATIAVRKSGRSRKIKKFELSSSLKSIPSIHSDQQKSRRKLRAKIGEDDDLFTLGNLSQTDHADGELDCEQVPRFIGQNGILSQTRKLNETTTTLSTIDDDFTIISQSQKTIVSETFVNYSSNDPPIHPTLPDVSIAEPMNILGDVTADEREQMYQEIIENDDNESLLTSLNRTNESHPMTNNNNTLLDYHCCIEDISNDGIDLPPASSSPSSVHVSLTT